MQMGSMKKIPKKQNSKLKHRFKDEPPITGHEWDGITEYDTPDPFWLRVAFYILLFFAIGYWLWYPSWPAPNVKGIGKWSSDANLEADQERIEEIRAKYQDRFDKASFEEVFKDEELMRFAIAGGRSTFQNNCAVCHGSGGGGNVGYPNLTAGAWLWGGKIEDIYTTLLYGIRSGHDEARDSNMAAFGKEGMLTKDEIDTLVEFVVGLNQGLAEGSAGHKLFLQHCASCHGPRGEGGRDFGAPALDDAIWLYGKDKAVIHDVIYNGRAGVMPFWSGKLSDSAIRQVAIYVHQLGGGEE